MPLENQYPYAENSETITDSHIENARHPQAIAEQFDLNREETINPNLYDADLAARRNEASMAARDLALTGFESHDAVVPPTPEIYTNHEYLSGITAMTRTIGHTRAIKLGLDNSREINPLQYVNSAPAKPANPPYASQAAPRPAEPIITRSYEDPTQEYGLAA